MKRGSKTAGRPRAVREWILAALLLLTVGYLAARIEGFLSPQNLVQLASDRAHIGLLALGMTFVILIAGIDLSVGSMVALSGILVSMAWQRGALPGWGTVLLALLAGTAAGALNGGLIAGARVPALIVTLATLSVYRGLAEGIGRGTSVSGFDPGLLAFGRTTFLGVPLPAWLLVVLYAGAGLYLSRTAGGRAIYAMGANEAAARLAGVPARRIRFLVYTFSGLLAGLAALTYMALNDTFRSDVGRGYELDAITIVILGGTSVAGGEGSVLGTALALALVAVGMNGMYLAMVPPERQLLVVAAVLVFSLWLDSRLRARRR